MVDLFLGKVVVKNNKDKDELDTEREIFLRLQNRILMLFFGSGECERELAVMFEVRDVPSVVVLRPDCSVLSPNAVVEICAMGPDCFRNWQEGAELIDRNFMMNEEFDEGKMRSMTDPIRRLEYKVEDKKKKKKKGKNAEEEEDDDGGGGGPWG